MKKQTKMKSGVLDDARRRELAIIHLAKKHFSQDEHAYRGTLKHIVGVESAADLDAKGRKKLIDYYKSYGFRPVHKSARASGMHLRPSGDRKPQLSKIGVILADLKLPWSYADSIAKTMHGVDRVRWLYPDQLQGVIVALINRQKHVKSKQKKGDTE